MPNVNTHNGAALTWNANTEPDMASYTILFGQQPGVFTQTLNQGTLGTSVTFPYSSFDNDGLWYFALTAIDTSGNASVPSSTVSKRIIRTASQFVRRK